MTALIVGARPGNLGGYICEQLDDVLPVRIADLAPGDRILDVRDNDSIHTTLSEQSYTGIVYCAGVNHHERLDFQEVAHSTFDVNYFGALRVFDAFKWHVRKRASTDSWPRGEVPFFVVVSSNSAHIARSHSANYCASKAALSMWTRCAGRAAAAGGLEWDTIRIWGYEPGWIDGTPMSDEVRTHLHPSIPAHRIPGGRGMDRSFVAARIANDISLVREGDDSFHGTMIRVDGGEQ